MLFPFFQDFWLATNSVNNILIIIIIYDRYTYLVML